MIQTIKITRVCVFILLGDIQNCLVAVQFICSSFVSYGSSRASGDSYVFDHCPLFGVVLKNANHGVGL